VPLAESASDSHNHGHKKNEPSHASYSPPPPPPSPSGPSYHPASSPSSARQHYRYLRFAPGINYQGVNPTLLQKMNMLGRTTQNIIQIISGLRTHQEQRSLYAAYKNGTGNIAAPPGQSYHEIGLAVDALIDGQAIGDVLPQEAFASVGLTNLKSIDDAPHVQLDRGPYEDDPSRVKFIQREAKKRGLDPHAVLAVASAEGLSGGVGDGGHAFGPWQLNDAGGILTNAPAEHHSNEWAWSDEGIRFALDHIAGVARGQKGTQAIATIVNNFERPADPGAEIARASAAYGSKVSGVYTGLPSASSGSGGFSGSSGGYYTGPVTGTVDAQGNSIGLDSGPYPLGMPTLPFETDQAGSTLTPHQAAQTWQMVANQDGASPETQSLSRRMLLYIQDANAA
jgi:hypothetical protein